MSDNTNIVTVELNPDSTITNEIRRGILLGLRDKDGKLKPARIVEAARDESHPLHSEFEWDDSVAGQKYRLAQAEQMIRTVTVQVRETDEPVRAFVSLREDRADRSGYRYTMDVLQDGDKTAQLLDETRKDAVSLLKKLRALQKAAKKRESVEDLIASLQRFAVAS